MGKGAKGLLPIKLNSLSGVQSSVPHSVCIAGGGGGLVNSVCIAGGVVKNNIILKFLGIYSMAGNASKQLRHKNKKWEDDSLVS